MAYSCATFKARWRQATGRASSTERGYDTHWNRLARMFRNQHPTCQVCHDAPAVDVDHIIPFRGLCDPLRTDVRNLQSICRPCHRAKTATQGAAREGGPKR